MEWLQVIAIAARAAPLATLFWHPKAKPVQMDRPVPTLPELDSFTGLDSPIKDAPAVPTQQAAHSYCPACETQKLLAIAKGYCEGLVKYCQDEIPEGLGGTVALAKSAVDEAQTHLVPLSQKPQVPASIIKLLETKLTSLSQRLNWIGSCEEAEDAASQAEEAWGLAYQAAVAIYAPSAITPSVTPVVPCPTCQHQITLTRGNQQHIEDIGRRLKSGELDRERAKSELKAVLAKEATEEVEDD